VFAATVASVAFRFNGFVAELKRRSVFKVTSVYAITAWGASMGAAQLLPAFGAPDWAVRAFVLVAILGLPFAAVLAWAYDITPKGIIRDEQDEADAGADADHHTTVLFGAQGSVRVVWTDGQGTHEKVLHRDFRFGRDESCEIHLDDPMVSRRHAEVIHSEGRWWVKDLGSRNGTLLNGKRVTRVPLPTRSEIKLYEAAPVMRIEVHAASAAQTVTS
jgi:hypothetical protein